MRHLYEQKREVMISSLKNTFKKDAEVYAGASGMEFAVRLYGNGLLEKIKNSKVKVNILESNENSILMLVSCGRIPIENIESAIKKLNDSLQN